MPKKRRGNYRQERDTNAQEHQDSINKIQPITQIGIGVGKDLEQARHNSLRFRANIYTIPDKNNSISLIKNLLNENGLHPVYMKRYTGGLAHNQGVEIVFATHEEAYTAEQVLEDPE